MGLGSGRGEENEEEQAAPPERVLGAGGRGHGSEKSAWDPGLAKAPCAPPTNPSEVVLTQLEGSGAQREGWDSLQATRLGSSSLGI